jgi:hypothetical protein
MASLTKVTERIRASKRAKKLKNRQKRVRRTLARKKQSK